MASAREVNGAPINASNPDAIQPHSHRPLRYRRPAIDPSLHRIHGGPAERKPQTERPVLNPERHHQRQARRKNKPAPRAATPTRSLIQRRPRRVIAAGENPPPIAHRDDETQDNSEEVDEIVIPVCPRLTRVIQCKKCERHPWNNRPQRGRLRPASPGSGAIIRFKSTFVTGVECPTAFRAGVVAQSTQRIAAVDAACIVRNHEFIRHPPPVWTRTKRVAFAWRDNSLSRVQGSSDDSPQNGRTHGSSK